MAIQTIVTCDVHGDGITEGEPTVVGFNGSQYEVDLCEDHREELLAFLEPFLAVARSGDQRQATRSTRRTSTGSKRGAKRSNSDVREWARAQGYEVSDRGRIPAGIIAEFEQAHAGTAKNGRKSR